MATATSAAPARRGRPVGERPVQGFQIVREYIPRQFVRRTITVELALDRSIRERAEIAGETYSGTVEKALQAYVADPANDE